MLRHPRKMFSAVAVFWLLLDFLTKQYITNSMELGQTIPLWEGVFQLRYVRNYGAAFSLLQGQQTFFFVAMAVLLVLVVWFWWAERPNHWMPVISTALVMAGALGNTFDRVSSGSVIDMFSFYLIDFPVFNVADIGIVVGCALFFVWFIFLSDKRDDVSVEVEDEDELVEVDDEVDEPNSVQGEPGTQSDSVKKYRTKLSERLKTGFKKLEDDLDRDD